MRKLNAVISAALVALLLHHIVFGAFQLAGLDMMVSKPLSWVFMALTLAHAAIGIKLSLDTERAKRKSGVSYGRENRLFRARRDSGFAMLIFLAMHIVSFSTEVDGVLRLRYFGTFRLASQLLLVAALSVHLLCNVRPLLIALGVRSHRKWIADILWIAAVMLLVAGFAMVVYFLRWNVF